MRLLDNGTNLALRHKGTKV